MKKIIIVQEADWEDCEQNTKEWEDSVEILIWEHDVENGYYSITYKEKI